MFVHIVDNLLAKARGLFQRTGVSFYFTFFFERGWY